MAKKIGRNDPCWCKSGRKYKACHQAFDEKIARFAAEGHTVPEHSMIKTWDQIAAIKESAKINIAVLDYVAEHIKAGMNTEEINAMVFEKTTRMGGYPAPLNDFLLSLQKCSLQSLKTPGYPAPLPWSDIPNNNISGKPSSRYPAG